MVELILAVGLAMSISAACSLCEAVLYSVPLRHVETMVHQRKWSGKIFRALRRDVDKPIAAILTLNTIANTGGAAIAGSAAAAVLGQDSLGYFSAALTLGILIFSEVLPKTTGVVYGRQLVPVVALPIRWLVSALKPLVWMINRITGLIARDRTPESISPDELKVMARLSLRTGAIKEYQEIIIDNVLSLDKGVARDVMTPRTVVFSLSEHLTCEEASTKSKRWEHSRFPVYDKNVEDIVGIVLTKELFMALARGEKDRRLTDIMRPVHFVAETARLNNVLMEFMGSTQHLSVVIDEYGGLSGVISLEDILEEILGREIMDESDQVADKRELARKRRSTLTGGQRAEGG
jgi:CBS domain containing-hemolysin-like protein